MGFGLLRVLGFGGSGATSKNAVLSEGTHGITPTLPRNSHRNSNRPCEFFFGATLIPKPTPNLELRV